MLQELWKSKAFWDDPIPSSILENWNKFTKEKELASAKILTTCTVEADSVLNSIPLVVKSNPLEPIISKFSNFTKLIRVIALCKRFINNCKSGSKVKGQLKSEEVELAHKFLVKTIQQAEYSQEISHLKYHKPIPRSSKLISLNIFLDEDEILRVGGRLTKQPTLSFDQKFPIIILKHHPITTLVIRQFHFRGFHSGTQMTLSLIRQHYWIPDGRSTVRREIKQCIECCRFNSKPSYPKMGDLPKQRITQTRPFEIVGIDFAGPILTKCQYLRKANKFKSYICLFICLATKAVHLELVSTLSTDAMLAALRRFIARRGHPSEIHSDNGTNFIGANNYLKQLYMLVKEHSIQKWKSLLKLRQHFWDRWPKEVLHHYQSRPKWKASQSEVQVGNLVLISDDNRPPLSWPMARILKLIPGTDGTNRVAILQTGSGLTRRSINKIVVLPICAREDGDSEIHH
ncbi:integrase catalytic domain-containing protein [Trichonephila clavipes]|uniref:Integrase catalytic domain-containing protein n=1 Tax=Trichonephila clavipes TaxID=2585209 RepID=A0A8X6S1B2_TRICX|nr:integrase catalytic domain-containing protein [Trichonephila clavipes]